MKNENANGKEVSLQVSVVGKIDGELFSLSTTKPFLVKNITDNVVKASIKPACSNYFIETTIYPGWNPELITSIKYFKEGDLQYGY